MEGAANLRILVLSDTHIPHRAPFLPPQVCAALRQADLILHAGDLASEEVLDELALFAPVEAVHGNMDPREVRRRLPRRKLLEIGGYRVGLVHGDGGEGWDRSRVPEQALAAFPGAHAVVFGHTHEPLNRQRGATLLFNPGSPTDPRLAPRCSFGWLHLGRGPEEPIRGEHVFFSRP